MFNFIDRFLNSITMYRLVLYVLSAMILCGFIFSFFHLVPFTPVALVVSWIVLTAVCWLTNNLCAWILKVPTNVESVYITAFILTLIITPALTISGFYFLLLAGFSAMASKYILAIRGKHVFNPAAVGVVATAFLLGDYASWWVGGNVWLLPVVLIGGLLIVKKIKRFDLVLSFIIAAVFMIVLTSPIMSPWTIIEKSLVHTTILFFAFIMITEPLTTPPTRDWRILYGILVGFLFDPAAHASWLYATPELALVAGNAFSYLVSPKFKGNLTVKEKKVLAHNITEFTLALPRPVSFTPGQYMEWTLPHNPSDTRGNRRYFTIASSPAERDVRLGVRFEQDETHASTFKRAMHQMEVGSVISAGQIAGDFTLPHDPKEKLAFIAGGIGVTPFRSMIQYLVDTKDRRDVVLLYSNKTVGEIAYQDIFDRAEHEINLKTVYAVTHETSSDPRHVNQMIDTALIMSEIPDYRERIFYISGPNAMVQAFEKLLASIGVPKSRIKTDFFPGFA